MTQSRGGLIIHKVEKGSRYKVQKGKMVFFCHPYRLFCLPYKPPYQDNLLFMTESRGGLIIHKVGKGSRYKVQKGKMVFFVIL